MGHRAMESSIPANGTMVHTGSTAPISTWFDGADPAYAKFSELNRRRKMQKVILNMTGTMAFIRMIHKGEG